MSFWAERLGQPAAPVAPPAPAAPAPPWWMSSTPPTSATPHPVTPPQVVQQSSVAPTGEAHFGDLLRQDGYTTTKARSVRETQDCPNCGSGNYMAGKVNAQRRCYDCGHNDRFEQTASGATSTGQNAAPPRPARVQNVSTGAAPMGTIIGHA